MSAACSQIINRIRIISNAQIRYEGDFVSIDNEEPYGRTITLANGRQTDNPIPARNKVYEKIKFRELDLLSVAFANDTSLIDDDPSVVKEGPCAPVGNKPVSASPNVAENETSNYTTQPSYSKQTEKNFSQQKDDFEQYKHPNNRRNQPNYTRGRGYGKRRGTYQNYGKMHRNNLMNGQNLSEQYKEEYDIESANKLLAAELEKLEIAEKSQDGDIHEDSINGSASGEDKVAYDKNKSFFDTLSSELMDRARGINSNQNRRNEQELNSTTFGISRAYSHNHNFHRGKGPNRRGTRGGGYNYMNNARGGRWKNNNYRSYNNNRSYGRRHINERGGDDEIGHH